MNIKRGIQTTIVIGAILMTAFHSAAMASHGEHCNYKKMSPAEMYQHMEQRLDKLAKRLEIKSSQQTVWEEFAKSVVTLAVPNVKKPNDDADATTIARYRAERATEFAEKLTKIADATEKLQTALTEDQRKILNQASRRFLHKHHGLDHEGHEGDRCKGSDRKNRPDEYNKDSR